MIRERVLGSGHRSKAATYNNMGEVYRVQGDYAKTLEYYEKALEISERVLENSHPDTATTYNNIVLVYGYQRGYAKALEYYEKAFEIRERVQGSGHPDTATTYNNMALVYFVEIPLERHNVSASNGMTIPFNTACFSGPTEHC